MNIRRDQGPPAPLRPSHLWPTRARQYLHGAGLVALATVLGLPLRPFIDPTNVVMLYLLAVILAALRLGRAPAIMASILSVVAFDVVFVPPFYTLGVADVQFLITFAGLLGVGLVISSLAADAREQARFARRREAHTTVLYELSRDLAAAVDLAHVTRLIVTHVEQIMVNPAVVYVDTGKRVELHSASTDFVSGPDEYEVAIWTFEHNEPAGRGSDTLGGARGYYLPLKTAKAVVGVLGVIFPEVNGTDRLMTAEQQRLLESFASQAAVAVERAQLAEKAQKAQLLQETERLQTALLNSISHDLRSPLASITGTLSSLRDDGPLLNERMRRDLAANAYEEAERLNRLVGNLLEMTRLEAGALRLGVLPVDIEDVVGVALSQLSQRLAERDVVLDIPANLPLVSADFVLLVQVFVNLIDNADKYAPRASALTIRSRAGDGELLVQVLDRGPGVPAGNLERIFEKFYRVEEKQTGQRERLPDQAKPGTGLGLSISKGIVEAHRGRIWAENREEGGAVFTVALPLADEQAQPATE